MGIVDGLLVFTEPPANKEGMLVHPFDLVGGLGGVGS